MVAHQGDVLILIGHEKESAVVQNHAIHMLQDERDKQFYCNKNTSDTNVNIEKHLS